MYVLVIEMEIDGLQFKGFNRTREVLGLEERRRRHVGLSDIPMLVSLQAARLTFAPAASWWQ